MTNNEEPGLALTLGLIGDGYAAMSEPSEVCFVYDTAEEALSMYLEENPAVFADLEETHGLFIGAMKRLEDGEYEVIETREIGLGLCIQARADN